MEDAYKKAMEIADAVAKQEWVNKKPQIQKYNWFISAKSWNELRKSAPLGIVNLHATVFQSAFEILSKKN